MVIVRFRLLQSDNGREARPIPDEGINHEAQPLIQHTKGEDGQLREAMLAALPRLRRFARSLAGNRHDADDLLQATVERVLARGIPGNADVTRWMFKVCRNLWIDETRYRDVRLRAAQMPELAEQPTVSGEAVAISELALREVDAAMAGLPEEQRAVISLVAVEGLTYRQAAEVLDTPIGTIMSRLARARAELARQLPAGSEHAPGAASQGSRP